MPDVWFVFGLALGVVATGACATRSFERGADSVRRSAWRDLTERRVVLVARVVAPMLELVAPPTLALVPRDMPAPSRRKAKARRRRSHAAVLAPVA